MGCRIGLGELVLLPGNPSYFLNFRVYLYKTYVVGVHLGVLFKYFRNGHLGSISFADILLL